MIILVSVETQNALKSNISLIPTAMSKFVVCMSCAMQGMENQMDFAKHVQTVGIHTVVCADHGPNATQVKNPRVLVLRPMLRAQTVQLVNIVY